MKQTLDLSPSSALLSLSAVFAGSPLVITGTVPSYPTMSTWMMQLWKRPHDSQEDDAEPLAVAVGGVTGTTVTMTFTDAQLALDLSNEIGANNHWLTIGGVDTTGMQQVLRAGTVEITPCPFGTVSVETSTLITVTNDSATFVYGGQTYSLPVSPITTPPGATEGQVVVIDDLMVYTIGGVSYSAPVVPIAAIPEPLPDENTTDYIVGSDGATYERTITPEGETYYKPVFTTAP